MDMGDGEVVHLILIPEPEEPTPATHREIPERETSPQHRGLRHSPRVREKETLKFRRSRTYEDISVDVTWENGEVSGFGCEFLKLEAMRLIGTPLGHALLEQSSTNY